MSEVNSNGGSSVATPAEAVAATTQPVSKGEILNEKAILEGAGITDLDAEEAALESQEEVKPKEKPSTKKKFKLKVDGNEEDYEIDLADEEALKREIQKARAFEKRSKEWSSKSQQFDQFVEMLQKNPETVLEKMGIDVDKLSEERLMKAVEKMKKSPEQLEREQMQLELEQLRQEKEEIQRQKEMAETERIRNEQSAQITKDITEAIEQGKSFLPKNAESLQLIGKYLYLAMKQSEKPGFEHLAKVTAKDVLPLVERDIKNTFRSIFDNSPEDVLEDLWGSSNVDRLRKKRIAAKKAATMTANQAVKDSGSNKNKEEQEAKNKQKKNSKDAWKEMFGRGIR